MTTNPLKQGLLTENSAGIGPITRGMVRERAVKLALSNGRAAHEVSISDWDQARQELTGGPEDNPNEAGRESDRWAPETGRENDEGRSPSARLVSEGGAEAEHDQMLQAARFRSGDK